MALIVEIKAVPSSGKLGCKLEGTRLKCYLKAAPEKGKANKELVGYLAKMVGIPVSAVAVTTGETTRLKRVTIDAPITFDMLCEKLGIQRQLPLF
jgi:uncharacterized protein YggU (UPF0235/DUF167 family)